MYMVHRRPEHLHELNLLTCGKGYAGGYNANLYEALPYTKTHYTL